AAVSPTVGNAKAQMISPKVADATSNAVPAVDANPANVQAGDAQQDNEQVVSSEELNELDKAATDDKSTAKIVRPVPTEPHAASAAPSEDVWGRTSLIGKIFIAFGSVLTLASAARMFIA